MLKEFSRPQSRGISLATYVSLIIFTLVILLQLARSLTIVSLEMDASTTGTMKIQWQSKGGTYSEFKSKKLKVNSGHQAYFFMLWDLAEVNKITLNPIDKPAAIGVKNIVIRTLGYDPVVYDTDKHFQGFKPNQQLSDFKVAQNQLNMRTLNSNAQFEFELTHPQVNNKNVFLIDNINIKACFILTAVLIMLGAYYAFTNILLVIIGIVVGSLYLSGFPANYAVINIEMQSTLDNQLTVYWAAQHAPYTEQQSRRIDTHSGEHTYCLGMGDLNKIQHIRIDPLATKGKVYIKQITLSAFEFDPIVLNAHNQFYALDFSKNHSVKLVGEALEFTADTDDTFFEISPDINAFQTLLILKTYLGFILLLILVNLGSVALKRIYPTHAYRIGLTSAKIGVLIITTMVIQLMLSPDYGFFIDYQANELVITTAGEKAQSVIGDISDNIHASHLLHIGLLNFAYAVIIVSALVLLSIFSKIENAFYLATFILVCGIIGYAIKDKNTLIHIEMDSSIENRLKVYWADEAEIYKERHSASVNTQKGKHRYTFAIANLNDVHNIRIEPLNEQGRVDISTIEINEVGYLPISLDAHNNFYAVDRIIKSKVTNKETTERLGFEQDKLVFTATDEDTFFELIVEPDAFKSNYPVSFYLKFILLLGGVFTCLVIANRKFATFQQDSAVVTLRVCLLIVAVMIIQMAWLSDYDVHPDEKAHIDSIDYYTQYWDPPKIGDQRSLNTYQYPWGVSRLDDLGISYLLMGKLKNAITYFAEDTVFTCRVFNSLLILYLLFATRHKRFALFLIPFLCLPQVWHLFSYANRDGFALWLAILLGWQVANERSYLQQYLNAKTGANEWRKLIVPTLLLGLLSIELTNYLIFILYFVAILIWQGIFINPQRKLFFMRCLVLVLLAGSFYGVRKAADTSLNGLNKQEQKLAYAEAIAAEDFKPSVAVTDEGYFGLRLQQKGVDALTLFAPRWEWQVLTFKSFTGLYGNEFAEYSPEWYYSYVAYLFSLIAIILVVAGIACGVIKTGTLTAITVIFIGGDLLMGFLYSWLYDFQPQGRYIFPLIPMLMVYIYKMTPQWGNTVKALLLSCALILFVLGLFSFRFIALKYLIS